MFFSEFVEKNMPTKLLPYSESEVGRVGNFISPDGNTLGAYISRLYANAGIEGGSASSARRTLAVKLHRKGYV